MMFGRVKNIFVVILIILMITLVGCSPKDNANRSDELDEDEITVSKVESISSTEYEIVDVIILK
jgi:hypothetical protein